MIHHSKKRASPPPVDTVVGSVTTIIGDAFTYSLNRAAPSSSPVVLSPGGAWTKTMIGRHEICQSFSGRGVDVWLYDVQQGGSKRRKVTSHDHDSWWKATSLVLSVRVRVCLFSHSDCYIFNDVGLVPQLSQMRCVWWLAWRGCCCAGSPQNSFTWHLKDLRSGRFAGYSVIAVDVN